MLITFLSNADTMRLPFEPLEKSAWLGIRLYRYASATPSHERQAGRAALVCLLRAKDVGQGGHGVLKSAKRVLKGAKRALSIARRSVALHALHAVRHAH